jgi:hypothetical protein
MIPDPITWGHVLMLAGVPMTAPVMPAQAGIPAGEGRRVPGMPIPRAYSLRRGAWRGKVEERLACASPHEDGPRAVPPSPATFVHARTALGRQSPFFPE